MVRDKNIDALADQAGMDWKPVNAVYIALQRPVILAAVGKGQYDNLIESAECLV
ncbi:hypothetical protein [Robbsia andropogonis]|uniref:hypothetical protein n=1 Tax=Robbsia andropogonis TaxID=28092 RepID=UPI0004B14398|nr:hypothetical protein [Robbsia andropogonis]MCP1130197.1 hypothetical protein [Robbsia andropogonis]